MSKLTEKQLEALADLAHGEWTYGIKIRGRHALPSLRKRGLVSQHYGDVSADQWQITDAGRSALSKFGTIRHLPTLTVGKCNPIENKEGGA